jgi:hypothetical protein
MIATLIGAAVFVANACGGSDGGPPATVSGKPITGTELSHWTSVLGRAEGRKGDARAGGALDLLIAARWTQNQAGQEGIVLRQGQAKRQLSLFEYDQTEGAPFEALGGEPRLAKLIGSRAVAEADRLWLMEIALLTERLAARREARAAGTITAAQVAAYYRAHQRKFLVPERRYFEIFMTYTRPAAKKARREVEGGVPFLTVAHRVSVDTEAPDGLQSLLAGHCEKEFRHHIFTARLNELHGPIGQGADFYVFRLLRITPAHEQALSEASPSVRRELSRRLSSGSLTQAYESRWLHVTHCRSASASTVCHRATA